MNIYIKIIILFLLMSSAKAQEMIYPYGSALPTDSSLKNLEWNRYTSADDNIVIMSIDNEKGKWMSQNVGKIHNWIFTRWGLPEVKFVKECRIFCVPNKELLKKLFGLDSPKCEIRDEVNVAWVILDNAPEKNIPQFLTPICISEFESRYNIKLGWWLYRGMSELNSDMPEIKSHILSLNDRIKRDDPIFVSQKMLTMTEEDYSKEGSENRKTFDEEAIVLCLMLRKEFGNFKLLSFLSKSSDNKDSEAALKNVYGFSTHDEFDKQYVRFMRDLTSDVLSNKTPDSYLTISVPKSR